MEKSTFICASKMRLRRSFAARNINAWTSLKGQITATSLNTTHAVGLVKRAKAKPVTIAIANKLVMASQVTITLAKSVFGEITP